MRRGNHFPSLDLLDLSAVSPSQSSERFMCKSKAKLDFLYLLY